MTLPLPLLRLDDLDCWTTDRCRKRRPINAHDAGYAPTFKPNLHLSAKLPPNYHTCSDFQRTCYRRASRPAIRWAVGYSRRSMILPLHNWQLSTVTEIQAHHPPRRLKQGLPSAGENMTRIAISYASDVDVDVDARHQRACRLPMFQSVLFFMLIILLAYFLHVSHSIRAKTRKSLLDVFQVRVWHYTLLVKDKYRAHVHYDSSLLVLP